MSFSIVCVCLRFHSSKIVSENVLYKVNNIIMQMSKSMAGNYVRRKGDSTMYGRRLKADEKYI
jgi:hypothetical protein